jgi:NhaP-type Na+/H+ or K+/H+ antiporter
MDIMNQALIVWTAGLFIWTVFLVGLTVKLLYEQAELHNHRLRQAWFLRRQERERHERF